MAKAAMGGMLRRRGAFVAVVAAGGVLAFTILQRVVEGVLLSIVGAGMVSLGFLADVWNGVASSVVGFGLPFALGVFLCLWLIAPVGADLHLGHVITRSALATAAGAVLVVIVQGVLAFFASFSTGGQLFGSSFPAVSFDGESLASTWLLLLQQVISMGISLLPLVILACVLLWIWLERHPREHAVTGMLDEV